MDITQPLTAGANFINGYSEKGFKVNGQLITDHIILTPSKHYIWEIQENIFAFNNYHYFIENYLRPNKTNSIVLIGTGSLAETAPLELYALFDQYGLSPEVMLTTAACRTYNVLIAEQRAVFALLKKI